MTQAQKAVLTTVEVAVWLGYSVDGVRRLCESGELDGAYRLGLGAHWRVPAAAVESYMQKHGRPIARLG